MRKYYSNYNTIARRPHTHEKALLRVWHKRAARDAFHAHCSLLSFHAHCSLLFNDEPLQGFCDFLRGLLHIKSFHGFEGSIHSDARYNLFRANADFERALSRLLRIDLHFCSRLEALQQLSHLQRAGLERVSALASLDVHGRLVAQGTRPLHCWLHIWRLTLGHLLCAGRLPPHCLRRLPFRVFFAIDFGRLCFPELSLFLDDFVDVFLMFFASFFVTFLLFF